MGSYEYHEFRAIDRPLSPEAREEVAELSSRADVGARHATFVYNYTSFRGDEEALLTSHFDAMFFIASWGSVRLVFSLPAESFEVSRAAPYEVEDMGFGDEGVTIKPMGDKVLAIFALNELELGWVEGEGILEPMLPLREHLLMGDDRPLYLAWLAAWQHGMLDDEDTDREPPVPAGLGQLDGSHRVFARCFGISNALLAAAAEISPPLQPPEDDPLPSIIDGLSLESCRRLLLRVAEGEQQKVHRELRRMALDQSASPKAEGRPLEVLAEAENRWHAEVKRRAHHARLDALEKNSAQLWSSVEHNLTGDRRRYKDAVRTLVQLFALATERDGLEDFMSRARPLLDDNRNRATFIKHMEAAGLGHLL